MIKCKSNAFSNALSQLRTGFSFGTYIPIDEAIWVTTFESPWLLAKPVVDSRVAPPFPPPFGPVPLGTYPGTTDGVGIAAVVKIPER